MYYTEVAIVILKIQLEHQEAWRKVWRYDLIDELVIHLCWGNVLGYRRYEKLNQTEGAACLRWWVTRHTKHLLLVIKEKWRLWKWQNNRKGLILLKSTEPSVFECFESVSTTRAELCERSIPLEAQYNWYSLDKDMRILGFNWKQRSLLCASV